MKHIVLTEIFKNLKAIFNSGKNAYPITVLLAVSGGADSMALLAALNELKDSLNCKICVVTVNHNIRPEKETSEDVNFVYKYCKDINVDCIICEIPKGEVFKTAALRKKGIEEAARVLRYREFKRVFKIYNASYILTAHNQNDFVETVLMRIFQGSDSSSLTGIAEKRDVFLRPMLNLKRIAIEDYLKLKNIKWREDSTNFGQTYLRNKIRHTLIPALTLTFNGWQTGLLNTIDKINEDNEFIILEYKRLKPEWNIKEVFFNEKFAEAAETEFNLFNALNDIFKIKFLKEGLNLLGAETRITHSAFKELLKLSETNPIVYAGGFCLQKKYNRLFLFKQTETKREENIECGYMIWIEDEGEILTPAGLFDVRKKGEGFFLFHKTDMQNGLGPFYKPFCIRSRLLGDTFFQKGLGKKTIKKILNEWNVDYEKRNILPIIEEKGVVCGIYGSVAGKKNLYNDRRR